jgi:hypothetical protein
VGWVHDKETFARTMKLLEKKEKKKSLPPAPTPLNLNEKAMRRGKKSNGENITEIKRKKKRKKKEQRTTP